MRFQLCGLDPTDGRALELHHLHARHARRPGEIVTLIGSVESVASVLARLESILTEREVSGSRCGSAEGFGVEVWGVGCARERLALDSWPNRSIPFPAASIPPRLSSSGRPGAAAGCSSGLAEERGALRGRERDRGRTEGTWGRTRSCSRP